MARLPEPGKDAGAWGQILNDYLLQSHNGDGTLKTDSVGAPQLKPNSVTNASVSDGTIQEAKLHADVREKLNAPAVIEDSSITTAKLANAGVANGVAILDGDARLPDNQLPDRLTEASLNNKIISTAQTHSSVLAPWFRALNEYPSSAKIALVGDSTRDVAAAGVNYHNGVKSHIVAGALLEGMADANILNFGFNGALVQTITSPANMASLATAAPDLVEFSFGINNIRNISLSTDQLEAILIAGVESIRLAVPGVPIIGTIPNSFLTTTDSGNYVSPNADAQLKSTTLRNAYLRLSDRWPDVIIRDTADIFGITSMAASPYMSDQIHPNATGGRVSADGFVALIGRRLPAAKSRIAQARNDAPYEPWTVYGREVEDTDRYVLVAEGNYNASGVGSYLDFSYSYAASANIQTRDLIELPDGQVFVKGTSSISTPGADTTRILDSGVPAYTQPALSGGRQAKVRVWRRRIPIAIPTKGVFLDGSWRYKRIGWVSTAATSTASPSQRIIDIRATNLSGQAPGEPASAWNVQAGDRLYIDGLTATDGAEYFTIGTGNIVSTSNNDLRISEVSQLDRSLVRYRMAVLVGTHA